MLGKRAESFYYVKYGSSVITSKILSKFSVMKTKKLVFLFRVQQQCAGAHLHSEKPIR